MMIVSYDHHIFIVPATCRIGSVSNFVFDKLNVEKHKFVEHYYLIFVFFVKYFSSNAFNEKFQFIGKFAEFLITR